jgi:hypothetical protein
VAWKAPQSTFGAAITGYTLQRATDAGFTQGATTWNVGPATSYLDSAVERGATYYYRVTAASANGTSDPSAATSAVASASGGNSKLLYLSARGYVGTGSDFLIGGFVVGGNDPKTVLIRASGPALAAFGVAATLPDPELQLYSGTTLLNSNTGWQGDPQVSAAAGLVSAFAWTNPSSADSALLLTLPPGAYTAQVSGASGDTGVSLLEVYDVP